MNSQTEWKCRECGRWVPSHFTQHVHERRITYSRRSDDPVRSIIDELELQVGEVIQIKPAHEWGRCLAVVDEVLSFGCRAYVLAPVPAERGAVGVGEFYIRLERADYERLRVTVLFDLPS